MKRLGSYILCPRGLLALAVVACSCYVSANYSAHSSGKNVFETLFMHLMPAPLVKDPGAAHGEEEYLLELPLKALPVMMPVLKKPVDFRHRRDVEYPSTTIYNVQIFQVASVLLCLICLSGVPRYLRTQRGDALTRMFAGFAMWIRDEMVYPTMGKEVGRKFLPYFLSVFFFIAFMNLVGLAPYSATATANVWVTAGMATTTLLLMVGGGMIVQGPLAYWKNLVPHAPLALVPLLFVVEVVGVLVKPFALTIRLFANMTGGHMVVLSFMGLIFFLAAPERYGQGVGWGVAPLAAGIGVFIMIVEAFVALLQAFIFTQLSIIFIQGSLHPDH